MNTKQPYTAPEAKILHLLVEGAILSGSVTGSATGADVTFENESDFDSFFN
jgi:energy-converting hydrogenase Eha subunit G